MPESRDMFADLKAAAPDLATIPEHLFDSATDPVYRRQYLKNGVKHKGMQVLKTLFKHVPNYARPITAITGGATLGTLFGNQAFHNYADR